ncbi:hypothetical protein MC7420_1690 [Coleofasciculus chthonoplastes PCC 7420]|uniref:Uncharacterized protein n=1 Tax=Coleofasciculus chthonoplastes PCC 7420 TaxID=118168 RepID=B4VMF0_9CYAN|nr:hypothetical protein [Coleofasciculus chthonoplastes]EDX76687.1 hypothetical protein MC7420_1690 [Coleofasciculus chthonoplastes PCC 7420]
MNRLQKAITIFGITATVNVWGILPSINPNGTLFSIATANGEEEVLVRSTARDVQVPLSEFPHQLTQSNPAPGMNRPVTDEIDVSLLAKTVANFIQAERYQTESEMQFSFDAQGFTGQFSVLVKTIAQSPQQFRTEISTPESGEFAQPMYIVVSDGSQVWIYQPELKQYAVSDYAEFEQSNDDFFIGLSSGLFLVLAPFRQFFANGGVSSEGIIEQLESVFQTEGYLPLQGNHLTGAGQDYYAYSYKDREAGFTFTFLVEPNTAEVVQIQISGKTDGIDFKMTEQIIDRVPSPVVAADTFTFVPPAGVTQVESMEIDIF